MLELEKILEEIEMKKKKCLDIVRVEIDPMEITIHREQYKGLRMAEDIIRKHMNDGWNSVEKYGLPKDEGVYDLTIINGLEEYVSVRWQFLSGTHLSGTQHYVDGVHYWADNYRGDPINEFLSERVIAWRKKPEPYRPERSDNHDGE